MACRNGAHVVNTELRALFLQFFEKAEHGYPSFKVPAVYCRTAILTAIRIIYVTFIRNRGCFWMPSKKAYRLKMYAFYNIDVLNKEVHHFSDIVSVDSINYCRHQCHSQTCFFTVPYCLLLDGQQGFSPQCLVNVIPCAIKLHENNRCS